MVAWMNWIINELGLRSLWQYIKWIKEKRIVLFGTILKKKKDKTNKKILKRGRNSYALIFITIWAKQLYIYLFIEITFHMIMKKNETDLLEVEEHLHIISWEVLSIFLANIIDNIKFDKSDELHKNNHLPNKNLIYFQAVISKF